MIDKVGHVKNPLTIIAIFAGLAEVCGTLMLPLMEPSVQKIFVWFLIFFPTALIVGFFIILWKKHTVLYAPSDYRSDDVFANLYSSSLSKGSVVEKLEQEALDIQGDDDEGKSDSSVDEQPTAHIRQPTKEKGHLDDNKSSNIEPPNNPADPSAPNRRRETQQHFIAEQIAVDVLSKDFSVDFKRNVRLQGSDRIYDAISITPERTIAAEIKFISEAYKFSPSVLGRRVRDIIMVLDSAYNSLPSELKKNFEGIGCVVIDGNINKSTIKNIEDEFKMRSRLNINKFPIHFKAIQIRKNGDFIAGIDSIITI